MFKITYLNFKMLKSSNHKFILEIYNKKLMKYFVKYAIKYSLNITYYYAIIAIADIITLV